jgi:LysM repeat protein
MFRVLFKIFLLSLLLILFLFPKVHYSGFSASAQGTCGETYTVLPGDTLSDIAEICQTTVVAILKANPEINDPTEIYVGQVITIPRSSTSPVLAISPTCGSAGNLLKVLGSGYPSNSTVEISIGPEDQSKFIVEFVTSDDLGSIDTEVYIPLYAAPYSSWRISAEADSGNIHFEGVSNNFTVLWPIPDPSGATTYTIQEGDTLRSIAVKFNRSVDALYTANPQIAEPAQLSVGKRLQIPASEPGGPQLKLSPYCGPADALVTVVGNEFPAGEQVNLRVGEYLATSETVGTAQVDNNKSFAASVLIPAIALPGENWMVQAMTVQIPNTRANSNIYAVIPPPDPSDPSIYIIQPQDTLNEIAVQVNRTPNAIMAANPQIPNANILPVGENLIIPGLKETVLLTPSSGPPGTRVQVIGAGFTPQSKVEIAFGKRGGQYVLIETAITNANGIFGSQVEIPTTALAGERWVILASQSVAGKTRIIALSNEFVVSKPKPAAEAFVSIWPTGGPPGTDLTMVASGFPANTQVTFSIGLTGSEQAAFLTTWTEINGTAAGDTVIPAAAVPGENLIVTVNTLLEPTIKAVSDVFIVTETDSPVYDSVDIFLVEQGGGEIGCGDAVLPVTRSIAPTPVPLTAAIELLISEKNRIDAISGLYNALYLSDLSLESIGQKENLVTIRLVGNYKVQDECDHPRVMAQIEQTARRYTTAQTIELLINGEPFDSIISNN